MLLRTKCLSSRAKNKRANAYARMQTNTRKHTCACRYTPALTCTHIHTHTRTHRRIYARSHNDPLRHTYHYTQYCSSLLFSPETRRCIQKTSPTMLLLQLRKSGRSVGRGNLQDVLDLVVVVIAIRHKRAH